MGRIAQKNNQAEARVRKVRSKISGTATRPRLAVKISNKRISAQLIDDEKGQTLLSVSKQDSTKTMTEVAVQLGEMIAEAASKDKISEAVLDRRDKRYHGRIKALTDAANKKGLKI